MDLTGFSLRGLIRSDKEWQILRYLILFSVSSFYGLKSFPLKTVELSFVHNEFDDSTEGSNRGSGNENYR